MQMSLPVCIHRLYHDKNRKLKPPDKNNIKMAMKKQ